MSCTVCVCSMYKLLTWVAGKSISYIALMALTDEASVCVDASGISITWIVKDALIYICV